MIFFCFAVGLTTIGSWSLGIWQELWTLTSLKTFRTSSGKCSAHRKLFKSKNFPNDAQIINTSLLIKSVDFIFRYLHSPVLFDRPEIGQVKFDVRYVLLLKSVSPLKVYAYDRFWLRFANHSVRKLLICFATRKFFAQNFVFVCILHWLNNQTA